MAWRLVYDTLFSRYLLFTNTVVSCGLEALGDLLVQKYEKNSEQEIDWARTKRMAVIGFILGPPEHYWFKFLDKRYPGRGVVSVFKKVTLDEVINGPACVIVFFLGMNKMSGMNWTDSYNDMKKKFWPVYKTELIVWPAAQVLNFFFVPPALRVTYISAVYLGWVMYLSYYQHKKS
ncbi:PREDICTED: mpv17-like protein 2 isoform X1 [Amphimedon queenslandica]|uniref:Mpv17-like protein 2 n=2 Tax=Amphimedon queenslandica TaxID=400682 RepID=A0A1X7TG23_AMPQE|nr:PREDICTED: mpv17-like protein 2 [Amphimedon queenslandica]XP_003390623.1 PREDICTED: mpv17-like protein 2 isoform X1 [Amphimedon queenslandica]|eukprot:XP_003388107.1 PREDICTED: mpv17-like protein 2 [Amphimedon queenslandica]